MERPVVDSSQLAELLPLAAEWAIEQEQRILREGSPLTPREIADARAAGVRRPEEIRVLPVESIPAPTNPLLRAAIEAINFLTGAPQGLTLRYGIFLRADCRQDRHLVAHELAHTAQYERLGGIVPFLRGYLSECATIGYRRAPLEAEATAIAERVCSA